MRVGTLEIVLNVRDAFIAIDGETIGTAPLPRPVILDAGQHRITATSTGYSPSTSLVNVVAGSFARVHVDLQSNERAPSVSHLTTPLWMITGVSAALTVGSVLMTLRHKLDYERGLARPQFGDPASVSHELQRKRSSLQAWLVATDILAGVTLLAGGSAVYFSVRPGPETASGQALVVGPLELNVGFGGLF